MSRIRLSVAMTHPIQYYAPWFRHIAAEAPQIQLMVHYCITPTPAQQGVGFEKPFEWDSSLLEGYDNVVLRKPSENVSIHSSSFLGVNVQEIGASIRKAKPDVVLVPGWYSVSLVRAAAESRLSGLPVVFRGDSQPLPDSAGLARRVRTQAFLRLYTSYLYVGKRNREFLAQNGISAERTFFSPHCVDNEMFTGIASAMDRAGSRKDAREELGIAPDAFVVLFAGKLEAIKRPWDVVRGAGALDGSVVVILAGSGNAEAECRSAAREAGANVKFAGFQNQAELGRLYGLSDCLVLPSQDETWGLVVNEAMAAGLPCIVSDRVGCGPDLIESGRTGHVVPVGDIAAFSRALDEIRAAIASGHDFRPACREKIAAYSFGAATAGLAAALDAELARR